MIILLCLIVRGRRVRGGVVARGERAEHRAGLPAVRVRVGLPRVRAPPLRAPRARLPPPAAHQPLAGPLLRRPRLHTW